MGTWSRRGVLGAAIAAGAGVLVDTGVPAALAGTPGRREPLDIITGVDAFVSPAVATAGAVTFRVHTTSSKTGGIGLLQLRPGRTEAALRRHMRDAFSTSGATAQQAARDLMATAEQLGGAAAHPGTDGVFTARLSPGSYLLLEYLDFEGPTGREPRPGEEYVRSLTVRDGSRRADAPRPHATITALDTPQGPRFALDGRLRAGKQLRYVNAMRDQIDALLFYPVTDDSVTAADVQAYFNRLDSNPPFDTTRAHGATPLSPGREVLVRLPVRPGRYAAVTWNFSLAEPGAPKLAALGQVLVVTVD